MSPSSELMLPEWREAGGISAGRYTFWEMRIGDEQITWVSQERDEDFDAVNVRDAVAADEFKKPIAIKMRGEAYIYVAVSS